MADFAPSRLSPATRILLALLVGLNVVVFFLATAGDDDAAEGKAPAAERRLPASTDPLKLLGELTEADRRSLAQPDGRQVPRATFPEEAPPELVCRTWGPFTSDETLEPARIAVAAVTDRLEVVRSEVAAPPDYLVYLDSDNNLDNARRLQKELESQNIEAYVIAGGQFVNSVSAGVFSQRASADRLVSRLEDLGYAPHLEALERAQEVRHLVALVPGAFELPDMASSPCGDIASGVEFL